MMLKVAFGCGGPSLLLGIPTVFASRHGDTTTTIELLECLASKKPVSANQFSHSVHNTQAGLFTIATGNRRPASALAAGRDTLGCSFLEGLGVLQRLGGGSVLLVIADEPLPPVLSPFVDEPQAAYAVAFLLEPHDGPGAITLSLGDDPDSGDLPVAAPWPQPVEFLRWIVSGEPTITLASPACRWTWRRADRR
jgi:hypothetical protein